MLAVIKHVVDNNIICLLSNTAHACTSAWFMQHNSTAAACAKLSTSFLLSYGRNRPELNLVDYKILSSLQQREYELQVNKSEEIKQRLFELWKISNNNI